MFLFVSILFILIYFFIWLVILHTVILNHISIKIIYYSNSIGVNPVFLFFRSNLVGQRVGPDKLVVQHHRGLASLVAYFLEIVEICYDTDFPAVISALVVGLLYLLPLLLVGGIPLHNHVQFSHNVLEEALVYLGEDVGVELSFLLLTPGGQFL